MVNIKPRDFEFPLTDDQHHYLARQPVFGPLQQVMAYDLIHCGAAADDDVGTCLAKHIDLLSAGRQVFVPATNGLIQSRDGLPLPPDGQQVVVVFPADIEVGDELLETVNHMTRKGYLIALGDFDYGKNHNALLPYADFIRLSVRGHSDLTLQRLLASLHEFRVRLIAEHVDSLGEFRRAQTLGFDGFMGGFYRQPHNAGPRDLSPASVSLLRLAVLVQEENLDARELERLISEDVVLSFQLLRYINSAAFSLRHKVESIRHAIVLLGHAEIRKWSALISILSANNKPNELIRTALWRASMCELLCEESGQGIPVRLSSSACFHCWTPCMTGLWMSCWIC